MPAVRASIWLELVWGMFNLGVTVLALTMGRFAIAAYAGMFGIGALYVGLSSLLQERFLSAAS